MCSCAFLYLLKEKSYIYISWKNHIWQSFSPKNVGVIKTHPYYFTFPCENAGMEILTESEAMGYGESYNLFLLWFGIFKLLALKENL